MDGGMSATLDVLFKPVYSGTRTAELVVAANGGINLEVIDYRVPLQGTGTGGKQPPPQKSLIVDAQSQTAVPVTSGEPAAAPYETSTAIPKNTDNPVTSTEKKGLPWAWMIPALLAAALFIAAAARRSKSRR